MFDITERGIISLNRGDSFEMPVFINVGDNLNPIEYKIDDRDIVYFGLMEPNQPFETAIVRKKYTLADVDDNGRVVVKFRPQDTQCLLPGKYYYQIKVQSFKPDNSSEYDVSTVVDKTHFFIME